MKFSYLSKKPVKIIFWLVVVGFILEFGGYHSGFQLSDMAYHRMFYEKKKQYIEDEYGISFKGVLPPEEFPLRWTSNPVLADQTVVEEVQLEYFLVACFRAVEKEIKKIPMNNMEYFKQIYCLEDLIVNGTPYGGTYDIDQKAVYLVTTYGDGSRASKNLIKRTFHHELSSLLMKHYNFDNKLWRAAHGENFQYEMDKDPFYQWMHLHGHTDPIDKETLYKRGLLRQYAETGVENDFNIYASVIFTNPKKMKRLIKEYTIIQRKYEVFKEFYLSIDAGFSPVFEKIEG